MKKRKISKLIAGVLAGAMIAVFGATGGVSVLADEVSEESDPSELSGVESEMSNSFEKEEQDLNADLPEVDNSEEKELSEEMEMTEENESQPDETQQEQETQSPDLLYDTSVVEESREEILLASTEPNYTQGGAGTRVDVTGQVKIWTTQRVRYDYDSSGRNYGSFFTVASNMMLEDGTVAGWSVCVDPKLNGMYAGTGGSFSKVYRFDAPLMKKAMYYADGTGHNYAEEVYAQSHGGSTDQGGVNILMHAAMAEIYARLGWAYKSSAGDFQNGASELLISDVKRYISLLNTLPDAPGEYYIYVGVNRDNFYQDFAFLSKRLEKGSLSLNKKSCGENITAGNDFYSIEGAEYKVYSDAALRNEVGSFETDKNGETIKIENLTAGTYYVKETKAPKGYQLDSEVHEIAVKAGEEATVSVVDTPLVDEAVISIEKRNAKENGSDGLTTAGTVFTIEHYPADYETVDQIPAGAPHRTWTIIAQETEEGVFAKLDADHVQDGSDDFYTLNGKIVLPYGTIILRETKAAKGFLNDGSFYNNETGERNLGSTFMGWLRGEKSVELFCENTKVSENGFSIADTPIYGGVKICKLDYETKSAQPQGDATLEGAEFVVINMNDYNVTFGGKVIAPGETVCKLVTDEEGMVQTGVQDFVFGRYKIHETKAPKGYSEIGITEREFAIEKNRKFVDLTDPSKAILNRVIRGDVAFRKIEASSQKSLAGIQFRITQIRTGENHTITVDENGEFDSRKSDLWFGEGEKQQDAGALPYGEYLLEELMTEQNANYQMYRGSFTVSENDQVIDLHNIENRDKPDLGTELTDEEGHHEVEASEEVTLIDAVSYYNFDQYIGKTVAFKGVLMDPGTGKPLLVDGKEVVAEATETIKSVNGQVKLRFTFDASLLEKKSAVAFENAYEGEGVLIAAHANIHDGSQTVKFRKKPEPKTPQKNVKSVKTGDYANVILWSGLLLIAGLTLGVAVIGMNLKKSGKSGSARDTDQSK